MIPAEGSQKEMEELMRQYLDRFIMKLSTKNISYHSFTTKSHLQSSLFSKNSVVV